MVKTLKKHESPDLRLIGAVLSASAGVLNPDAVIPAPVPMLKGKTDLLNPPVMTQADIAEISSGEVYIVTFARVTYCDVYGISHWINYCTWQSGRLGTYQSEKCVTCNDVDNN